MKNKSQLKTQTSRKHQNDCNLHTVFDKDSMVSTLNQTEHENITTHQRNKKNILENTLKTCTPLSWKIIKDMDKFLYLSTLPKISQDYTDNFNKPVAEEAINTLTKILLFSSINFFY